MRGGLGRLGCRLSSSSFSFRPPSSLPPSRPAMSSAASVFSSLPIIDLAPLVDPNASEKHKLQCAEALHHAAVNVGFLYVKNHGVDPAITTDALQLARAFFALPKDVKEEISIRKVMQRQQQQQQQEHEGGKGGKLASSISCRGYQRVGENVTMYARDLHEAIDMYREGEEHSEGPLAGFGGHNPWLDDEQLPGFRLMFEKTYVAAMMGLGGRLMRGFALGFGLPEHYFTPHYDRSFWCLRVIRYPPVSLQERESLSSGLGCGEHSDYGCLTLLNMDDSKHALQAYTAQGEWTFADPIPHTLLVNIGDMLSRWSNGKFKSTPHRVLPAVGKQRVSIPFFFEPNLDTLVEPLQACESFARAQGKVYSPILFADHLRLKVTNNFSFLEPSVPDAAADAQGGRAS